MDTKLLLVKSATLLYRESQQSAKSNNSADIVNAILQLIKVPEGYTVSASEFGKDPISGVRETVRWMTANPVDYTYDKSELLQRLRVNAGNDESLFQAFYDGIEPELGEDGVKKICVMYRGQLRDYINQAKVKDILKRLYTQSWFQPSSVDWRHFIPQAIEDLTPFMSTDSGDGNKHPALVTEIDFNNPDSLASAFERTKEEMSTDGVFRTGLQGINRMCGRAGGFRRGEFVLTSGLQFSYKSGLMLDLFRQLVQYNKPLLRDKERKPMTIRISLENGAENDVFELYKRMCEMETGIKIDHNEIDPKHAAQFVYDRMQMNGFNCKLFRYDPTDFTFYDLFDMIERYEADGYEIQILQIDYLNMMSKKGCTPGPAGHEIRDLFRRVRNFTNKRGILTMTPHQLSGDAKMLKRAGVESLVQEVAGKGYYDSCKSIDQEVDLEIHHAIEQVNGEFYLAFQRGKHRTQIGNTPVRDQYTVYKMHEIGGLIDDVLGPDMSSNRIGAQPNSTGGKAAWWDI